MGEENLAALCVTAFTAVFVLLAVLAGVMELIMKVFPQKIVRTDAAFIAAITSTYNALIPGAKVTRIEESK
ncbi:hypothetical protein KKG66_07830 [bacterium]|nr:hypothetical protein [bacterium]MBU1920740.1 hypothetical protein [bacterium]